MLEEKIKNYFAWVKGRGIQVPRLLPISVEPPIVKNESNASDLCVSDSQEPIQIPSEKWTGQLPASGLFVVGPNEGEAAHDLIQKVKQATESKLSLSICLLELSEPLKGKASFNQIADFMNFDWIICFGPSLIEDSGIQINDFVGQIIDVGSGAESVRVGISYSPSAFLKQPFLKRDLWQQIVELSKSP